MNKQEHIKQLQGLYDEIGNTDYYSEITKIVAKASIKTAIQFAEQLDDSGAKECEMIVRGNKYSTVYNCSSCNYYIDVGYGESAKFCSNCGAKIMKYRKE